jgi:hypothetical protein
VQCLHHEKVKFETEFPVTQVVGSLAIEGIRVSPELRANVTRVINGEVKSEDLRRELVKRYGQRVAI